PLRCLGKAPGLPRCPRNGRSGFPLSPGSVGTRMSPQTASPAARLCRRIGKYEILAHVATGGMAAIYQARDTENGRPLALKVLSPEWSSHPLRLERFRREAIHCAKLNHENIVSLYEHGEDKGVYYLALEYVDGCDLFEHIQAKGQLAPEEARRLLIGAVRAL